MSGWRILASALFVISCCAQNTYTISGTVVAENSGKALKRVMVGIREAHGESPLQAAVLTGDDGRFVFSNLPRGKFSLAAQKENGFVQPFHQDGGYSTAIVTGPGLQSENILFPLTVLGSIGGTVLDEDNEPVRNAQIMLFRHGVFAGKAGIEQRQFAQTDTSGMFHFARVFPGTFVIAVLAQPWYAQNGQFGFGGAGPAPVAPEFDVVYPITYYGGSTDPNAAGLVTVAGGVSTKIEIALHPVAAAHVQLPNAGPEGNSFNFTAIGPGGLPIASPILMSGSEGGMQVRIAPGPYRVETPKGGKRVIEISGNMSLDEKDIPESTLSGKLVIEGEDHPQVEELNFVSIDHPDLQAEVGADGSFTVKGAEAGRYEVQMPNGSEYYVKSVVLGERPLPGDEIEVAEGGSAKISVVAAKGVSNVDGLALKDGAPFAGAMVLLIPQNLNRTSLIRCDQSDSDGTFTLQNVAPGRYTLVAIDNGHDLPYAERGVINPYLPAGEVIDVPVATGSEPKVKIQHRQH